MTNESFAQFTSPLATPKSKYSKLFESSSSTKKNQKNNHSNSVDDEFRETVLEFINDVDADNKLEYKELLRRWVQIRGRPKNDTEKTILKELTKSHAFGISSKKTDITSSLSSPANNKRKSSENESSFNKSKKVKTVQNSGKTLLVFFLSTSVTVDLRLDNVRFPKTRGENLTKLAQLYKCPRFYLVLPMQTVSTMKNARGIKRTSTGLFFELFEKNSE